MVKSVDELLKLASDFCNQALDIRTAKEDPKAHVRNRGTVIFPAESPKVSDNKDHFPINNKNQAENALGRANQFSKAPEWYRGSLQSFLNAVVKAVKHHYPSIEVSKASKHPGKG